MSTECVIKYCLCKAKTVLIRSSRVSALQGLLSIGRTVGTRTKSGLSELSFILWVSPVEGCLLSGVPLYYYQMDKVVTFVQLANDC